MIKQLHVSECDSTQDLLKEQLMKENSSDDMLISCENQISGRGRGEKKWKAMPGTLCFSLKIQPHQVMSFTALELSVLIAKFFETKDLKLSLKWPNDLWNEEFKKCGGILVQGSHNLFLAGIGINLYSETEEYGAIYKEKIKLDKKELAKTISEFILANRYKDTNELKRDWLQRCGHFNQMVQITEGDESYEGIFQGLGDFGEALVCVDSKVNKIFNGTLRISS